MFLPEWYTAVAAKGLLLGFHLSLAVLCIALVVSIPTLFDKHYFRPALALQAFFSLGVLLLAPYLLGLIAGGLGM